MNEIQTSLKSFYDQLEPEIKELAWRTKYVTHLEAEGKERIIVTEDYSTAVAELFTKRLQELGQSGTKFELSSKVFTYRIPVCATRSTHDDIIRDLFGSIEWAGGSVLQIPTDLNQVVGTKLTFLPWGEKGPVAGWTSWSLEIPKKTQAKPLNVDEQKVRIMNMVVSHLSLLSGNVDLNNDRVKINKIATELEILKDEFVSDPDSFFVIQGMVHAACIVKTPKIIQTGQTGYGYTHYKPEGLAIYLGMVSALFPYPLQ